MLLRSILLACMALIAAPAWADCQYNTTPPSLSDASRTVDTCDTSGSRYVNTEGRKATYSAATQAFALAQPATDFFCITGSASKTIRVTRMSISGTATGATSTEMSIIKRGPIDTAGTSTVPATMLHDSTNAAGTAVLKAYTVNPTLGTSLGLARSEFIALTTTGGLVAPWPLVWDFTINNNQGLVIRGAAEQYCLRSNNVSIPGAAVSVDVQWTEE